MRTSSVSSSAHSPVALLFPSQLEGEGAVIGVEAVHGRIVSNKEELWVIFSGGRLSVAGR